jgi:hypothetical protein
VLVVGGAQAVRDQVGPEIVTPRRRRRRHPPTDGDPIGVDRAPHR